MRWGEEGELHLRLMRLGPTTSAPKDVMRRLVGSEALVDHPTEREENLPQASNRYGCIGKWWHRFLPVISPSSVVQAGHV